MFIWDKGDLNPAQEKAIEQSGSVFLAACPGSGKTRTLTYKIARLLSELESGKKRVLAITYTHRAADEIHERIEQLGVDTSQLWIGTIHAFCLEWILRPYAIYHPTLQHGFRVINGHDTEQMLDALCSSVTTTRLTSHDCGYYATPTGFKLTCRDTGKQEAIKKVLKEYWRGLRTNRQLDFELILSYSHQMIQRHSPISTLLGSIFSCVMVDEFQDTRKIQYEILAAILKASKAQATAFIVGDPNQAIYGSLGGYAISAEEFGRLSGLAFTAMELSDNYRSSSRIVGYFGNYNVLTSKSVAVGPAKDFPSLVSFDSCTRRDALEAELVRLIRYNIEVLGIAPQEVCIVAPWWAHLASMTRRLATVLPEYTFDGPGMVPFARDTDNFWYKLARIILTQASPPLFVRRMRWAGEVLAGLRDAGVEADGLEGKTLLRICNSIVIDETDGLTFLREAFEAIFLKIGIDWRTNESLREHHEAFFDSSQRRIDRLVREGSEAIAEVALFRRVFAGQRGITISSIHGVKGAEYDTVIAFGLLEDMVPNFNEVEPIDAAKKLLYVIASRARKNLHLISERGRSRRRGPDYEPTKVLLQCVFSYDSVP
ncbi:MULTISPECIES: UvrD-helicase domain-containing protein [unclassified Novosphingobium]|uniref:UvrD-helicase domain-containing protein n=1 Tax=unclassified Novosphingobium TaxID=2644732 RepID=UPI00086A34C2|nr:MULTISPECIES: ATP-dependent helicase [unclassified Novosphingobium]MBN9146007.1 ATP-dependent helicase [Novosphingobium sp.]ODU79398.1 MAG: ATP-dependent DNA helicase [Novosphingobium sp. SCN 63-17]OJX94107.1 MAG: ATP-dependent DNA helicase [Novosphingobium sp. 63-713]